LRESKTLICAILLEKKSFYSKLEQMGSNHRGRMPGTLNKKSLLAAEELVRLAANPIEMLDAVYHKAMDAFDDPSNNKNPAYLATALQAASKLASFRYPTLSAVAVKDLDIDDKPNRPLNTRQALEIIKADPFAPKEIQNLDLSFIPDKT